jgi:uncharacterized membrane protein
MAGIGFSLRKILSRESLSRTAAAYTVSGIISGGPWLIAIVGLVVLSAIVHAIPGYDVAIAQFQISVTYLIVFSLIFSGPAGNSFSRYAADQLFLNRPTYVISNLNGLMLIITATGGLCSFLYVLFLFPEQNIVYRFLLMGNFIVLTNIWVVITLLTAIKDYKIILKVFCFSYLVIVCLAYLLQDYGLNAFVFSFLIGQIAMLFLLLVAVYLEFPTNSIIEFHFLKKNEMFKVLIFSGFFFNLALWVDKFFFWYGASTSYQVIGPFRASWFYDLPILLAYLCLLPGMAVFLLLMETNFASYYTNFDDAIRCGKSFSYIKGAGDQMIGYAMDVIYSIVKIQAMTIILVFQFGEKILSLLHVSNLYYNVLYVAVIGTSLQVILTAIISILYHMDRRWDVLVLSFLFFILNLIFTPLSIYWGPFYYGFGFTIALMVVSTYGMYLLNEEFTDLEYKVIMLREQE